MNTLRATTSRHTLKSSVAVLWVTASLMVVCGAWNAQAAAWTNTAGGIFSEAANWDGSVPGTADTASFNAASDGTYTVTLTADAIIRRILFRFGGYKDVTFDLGGNDLVLLAHPTAWNDAAIETRTTSTSESYSLRFTNGTVTAGAVMLGAYNATVVTNLSTMTVGNGATLVTTGAVNVARFGQHATLRVEDGGKWEGHVTVNHSGYWMYLGDSPGCYGTICVDGPGSEVDLNAAGAELQYVVVGEDGTGMVHAVNGGKFLGADQIVLGRTAADSCGTLWAQGDNSKIATVADNIAVGVNGKGYLIADDGGRIESGASIIVYGDTIDVDGGLVATTNQLYFYSGSTYKLTLNQPDVSPMHCFGTFRIFQSAPGVTLELALGAGFQADVGDEFIVCSYVDMTAGPFVNLAQDDEIEVDDYTFQIDYGSGTNDKVTLTATKVPPRGTVIMFR